MHSDHMSTFVSQNFGQGQVHGQPCIYFPLIEFDHREK